MAGLQLFVLGTPRIEWEGQPVKLERRKAFALLVYIAVTGQSHRRDTLATLLWPDLDQTRARAALRRTLASLKKDLNPYPLEAHKETVGLVKDADSILWSDIGRFRSLLESCRVHNHAEAERCATCPARVAEAVALYRGIFLAGFTLRDSLAFDCWQLLEAETLQHELESALERLVQAHARRGEFELALAYGRQWLALDPLNEQASRYLMALQAWLGQRQAAFRLYGQLCRQLERELGVSPQPETVALYQALRDASGILPSMLVGSQPRAVTESSMLMGSRPTTQVSTLKTDPALALFGRIVRGHLVGREPELRQMVERWERAAGGQGQTLFLSGEPGIGKTRLAQELVALAEESGAVVLTGRCQAAGDAPYAPIAQIIRAGLELQQSDNLNLPAYIVADLLALAPHLRPRYPQVLSNPQLPTSSERQRMFESFASWCELLAAARPLMLWIDDVHWADDDTLALLNHLAHHIRSRHVLIVMTYRDTELALAGEDSLQELVLGLNRARLATSIRLRSLSPEETRKQLASILASEEEISDEFLDSIHRQCEGNPFFVEEVCRALVEEGKLYRVGDQWRRSDIEQIVIPQSVRAAILGRVNRLPHRVQETLHMAAVVGRDLDVRLLRLAGEWDQEELFESLEYAKRAHLLDEDKRAGETRLVFAHALIPFAIREWLGMLRLQRLHQRVASAIESCYPGRLDSLAYHYAAAGETGKARFYSLQAAEMAEKVYAYDSAIRHLQTALRFSGEAGPAKTRMETLEQLADVLLLQGDQAQAAEYYQEALAFSEVLEEMDIDGKVRLRRKFGESVFGTEWIADVKPFAAAARTALAEAMSLVADHPAQAETVRLLICASQAAWRDRTPQDWDTAEEYAQQAVAVAQALNVPAQLSAALDALAVVAVARGQFHERLGLMIRRLELSQLPSFTGERERAHLLNEVGVALTDVGRYAEAIGYHEEAEALGIKMRAVEEVLYALRSQALCAYRLDRWTDVPMEAKFDRLRQILQDDHLSPMCLHLALRAAVLGLQGQFESARATREKSVALMIKAEAPERWGRPAHY